MSAIDSELGNRGFRLGPWEVEPARGLIRQGNVKAHLEPLVMDVLLLLASNQGQVVSKNDFVKHVWKGRATADEAIAAKVSILRRELGDSRKEAVYVETLQKRGYRLKVPVQPLTTGSVSGRGRSGRRIQLLVAGGVAVLAIAIYVLWPRPGNIESVAVLQFKNLSQESDQFQYVADGFSEELVVSLDRVPELRIMRGPPDPNGDTLQQIAERLGVDAIVSGSLRTDGNELRITIELVSANGFQLWAERIDGHSRDIFSIQERVADRVRAALKGDSSNALVAASRPANSDAYYRYMRGLSFLDQRDPSSLETAYERFQEAIAFDPTFGPAYLRQAVTLLLLGGYSGTLRQDNYDAALQIADRGVQADPAIRDSMQLVYAFVHHQRGQWTMAQEAYEQAIRASTVFPTAHHWYSRFLGDVGFPERSLEQALIAMGMDPGSRTLISRVALAYLAAGDMEKAGEFFAEANDMGVGVPDYHFYYAVYLLRLGRFAEATEAATTALNLAGEPDWWVDAVVEGIADPDDPAKRTAALAIIDNMSSVPEVPVHVPIVLLNLLAEEERMMQIAIRRADNAGVIKNSELLFTNDFTRFRQSEGFPVLLQKIGLSEYWSSVGCAWENDKVRCHPG
ncbi:MAG: winged helix-turn-helix domain-containing protein [Woeseiaceae bacterium]